MSSAAGWAPGCVAALLLVLLPLACSQPRAGLSRDEAERVAWYVEDLAHGQYRDPDELRDPDGGPGLAAVTAWLSGPTPPSELRQRQLRWPAVRAACADGRLAYDADGLLRPRETQRNLAALASNENLSREALGQALLRLGGLKAGTPAAVQLTGFLAQARIHYAQRAGAQLWMDSQNDAPKRPTPPSASSSTSAATTSTSAAASWAAPVL